MKRINILKVLFSVAVAVVALQACQDDPEFPDPGFEIKDKRVEVRRDTADYYNVQMEMSVPNGVNTIQLINATDYSVLETIEGYAGKTNFTFDYTVDLTEFTTDTVLAYIFKVIDNDFRTFNRGIRIDVKGFSSPQITLVGGTNLAVAAPAYVLKGIVSTGLNAIKTVRVSFEGNSQYEYNSADTDTVISEMILKQTVFLGNLVQGQEYHITIYIEDDKGQTSETTVKVRKSTELKKPIQINYLNRLGAFIRIKLHYDEFERITSFDYVFDSNGANYYNEFHYNDAGLVDTIFYRSKDKDGAYDSETRCYLNYIEGTNQLTTIEKQSFSFDSGNISEGTKTVESRNFVYNADGTVKSLYTTRSITEVNYVDPFGLGEKVYAEYWQNTTLWSYTNRHQHYTDFDPILLPTFMEGLSPFVAPTSTMLEQYNILFWPKYVMTNAAKADPSYTTSLYEPTFKYETDEDSNITSLTKTYTGGGSSFEGKSETYYFFYE